MSHCQTKLVPFHNPLCGQIVLSALTALLFPKQCWHIVRVPIGSMAALLIHSLSTLTTDGEIDGQSFLELTEPELRELLNPFKLGVLKKVIRLQKEVC